MPPAKATPALVPFDVEVDLNVGGRHLDRGAGDGFEVHTVADHSGLAHHASETADSTLAGVVCDLWAVALEEFGVVGIQFG